MCNLYSNNIAQETMRRLFKVKPGQDRLGNQEPLPAIFPKNTAPMVTIGEDGDLWCEVAPTYRAKSMPDEPHYT